MTNLTTTAPLSELEKKMDFWLKHGRNVLLSGQQGVGKSTLIEEMAKRNNLTYRYFTASLMDPYLNLIGVPKEQKDENGESFLEFIKPTEFGDDSVEFIFLDEYNRAPPAVRNAVMELVQYRSVNGRKLRNLKAVWAAINPYDDNETFNVFEIDPAQKDRFHVYYELPFEPSRDYFEGKFGKHMAETAIKWWNKIPEDIRRDVSPRRLDYALEEYQIGGDVKDILHPDTRPDGLVVALRDFTGKEGSHLDRWMADSEGYLAEITDRVNPFEGDVVEAFAELKKFSMDQAVDYVGRLSPAQLQDLVNSDTGEIEILLRNLNGPKTPSVETALRENHWSPQHMSYVLSTAEDVKTPGFKEAYKANDPDKMLAVAKTGLDFTIVILWWLKNRESESPTAIIRKAYEIKGNVILRYLAMASFEETAKLFTAE